MYLVFIYFFLLVGIPIYITVVEVQQNVQFLSVVLKAGPLR